MKLNYLLGFCLFLFPLLAIAEGAHCKTYPFLKQGFNFSDYEKCHQSILKCPQENNLPKLDCVNNTVQHISSCMQMAELSKVLQMPASALIATQMGKITVIDKVFFADGQHQYYFITPQGCLIDTKIDPRELDKSLAKKYQKFSFFIVNWKKPEVKTNADGSQTFEVSLRVTDTCLACPVIGWATLQFKFSATGQWAGTTLLRFKAV